MKDFTQEFTEFFITYGQQHHPASKDSVAQWVKEVMSNSGLDTEIFKLHNTTVASNSATYKLAYRFKEVLNINIYIY